MIGKIQKKQAKLILLKLFLITVKMFSDQLEQRTLQKTIARKAYGKYAHMVGMILSFQDRGQIVRQQQLAVQKLLFQEQLE